MMHSVVRPIENVAFLRISEIFETTITSELIGTKSSIYFRVSISRQNCYDVSIEDCKVIQKEVQRQDCVPTYVSPNCQQITETQCRTITRNTCESDSENPFIAAYGSPDLPDCRNVEKEVCQDIEVNVPRNVVRKECTLVPQQQCDTITR